MLEALNQKPDLNLSMFELTQPQDGALTPDGDALIVPLH